MPGSIGVGGVGGVYRKKNKKQKKNANSQSEIKCLKKKKNHWMD